MINGYTGGSPNEVYLSGSNEPMDPFTTNPSLSNKSTPGATLSPHIITPADSLYLAAFEASGRSGNSTTSGGSGFGERLHHVGSSISHLITDVTHNLASRAHDTFDKLSHTAHDITDAVSHVDYHSLADNTRSSILARKERNLAIACGVGVALGLLACRRK